MKRPLLIALAAAGPLFVAVLRFVLPYYTASDNTAAAADVAAHPGTQSLVLWLGLGAMLTLVPGLFALWPRMPAGRLRDIGFSLAVVGYLCIPGLLVTDQVLWLGADQSLSTDTTAQLAAGIHASALVQMGLFVPAHIIGIVLIGVLALRRHLIPAPVAWALTVSQPLHLASVISGLPVLDLTAWTLTAVGTAWLTAKLTPKHEQLPGGSTNTNDEGGSAMTPDGPSSSVRRPTDPLPGKS